MHLRFSESRRRSAPAAKTYSAARAGPGDCRWRWQSTEMRRVTRVRWSGGSSYLLCVSCAPSRPHPRAIRMTGRLTAPPRKTNLNECILDFQRAGGDPPPRLKRIAQRELDLAIADGVGRVPKCAG